jgi:hypothetical protein
LTWPLSRARAGEPSVEFAKLRNKPGLARVKMCQTTTAHKLENTEETGKRSGEGRRQSRRSKRTHCCICMALTCLFAFVCVLPFVVVSRGRQRGLAGDALQGCMRHSHGWKILEGKTQSKQSTRRAEREEPTETSVRHARPLRSFACLSLLPFLCCVPVCSLVCSFVVRCARIPTSLSSAPEASWQPRREDRRTHTKQTKRAAHTQRGQAAKRLRSSLRARL